MISKTYYESTLESVPCSVKNCPNQAIYIEEIDHLESKLTKQLHLDGYVILCKGHYQSIFKKPKGTTISFVNNKGEFHCTRCKKSWKNTIPNHGVPKTCKHCTNIRWNKAYIKEKIVVGVKKSK